LAVVRRLFRADHIENVAEDGVAVFQVDENAERVVGDDPDTHEVVDGHKTTGAHFAAATGQGRGEAQ